MKKKSITEIRSVLHELLKNLPAIRRHSSPEVIKRHLQLIAFYQHQYDLLCAQHEVTV